jgi:hypothetical protein
LKLDVLLLRGILDVDLVTWEEHSKYFGYISCSTTDYSRNPGEHSEYFQEWDVQPHFIDYRIRYNQGCHTGRLEAFWQVYRAGGPVHYALYEPGGVL